MPPRYDVGILMLKRLKVTNHKLYVKQCDAHDRIQWALNQYRKIMLVKRNTSPGSAGIWQIENERLRNKHAAEMEAVEEEHQFELDDLEGSLSNRNLWISGLFLLNVIYIIISISGG